MIAMLSGCMRVMIVVMLMVATMMAMAMAMRRVRFRRPAPAPPKSAKLRDKQVEADPRDERVAHAFERV